MVIVWYRIAFDFSIKIYINRKKISCLIQQVPTCLMMCIPYKSISWMHEFKWNWNLSNTFWNNILQGHFWSVICLHPCYNLKMILHQYRSCTRTVDLPNFAMTPLALSVLVRCWSRTSKWITITRKIKKNISIT